MTPRWLVATSVLVAGCGAVAEPHDDRSGDGGAGRDAGVPPLTPDARSATADAGTTVAPGAAYEPCGSPVSCREGTQPRFHGATCVCEARCSAADSRRSGAPSCPSSPGLSAPYCTVYGFCELPCTKFGDAEECPAGLACGVTDDGLRCITTPLIVDAYVRPDRRDAIRDFELYGACRTFEKPDCPTDAMGASVAVTSSTECFCSAVCFDDGDCPVPPTGYGRAVCLRTGLERKGGYSGHCALVCREGSDTFACPSGLSCKAAPPATCYTASIPTPASDVFVCHGGYYRHGDGDDVIEPGEAYSNWVPPSPTCDPATHPTVDGKCEGTCGPGLGVSSNGRCVTGDCCTDDDCPPPPPGYPPPVCSGALGECFLSCTMGADCPADGFVCGDVNDYNPLLSTRLGCK